MFLLLFLNDTINVNLYANPHKNLNLISEYELNEYTYSSSRRSVINRKRHNDIDYKMAHYSDAHPNKKLKNDANVNENEQNNISMSQSCSSLSLNKYDFSIDNIPHR